MALGFLLSPQLDIDAGLTMGEDAVEGLAYKPDASGVLTKCGTSDLFGVFPKALEKSGYPVGATLLGCVTAKAGSGGVVLNTPVTYGANGTMVTATEGTDHIVGFPLHTAADTALFTMAKIG